MKDNSMSGEFCAIMHRYGVQVKTFKESHSKIPQPDKPLSSTTLKLTEPD